MSLPGWSAGWALPANTNCTGRLASSSRRRSRSGCDSSSVARLYVANRRAKPMVSACGSSSARRTWSARTTTELGPPCGPRRPDLAGRQLGRRRPTTPRRRRPTPAPTLSTSRSATPALTHVCACTPLVIAPIGTSSTGTSGHRPWNISRLTAPCSRATPLLRPARRRPMTAMLKRSSSGSSGRRPTAISSSNSTPSDVGEAARSTSP